LRAGIWLLEADECEGVALESGFKLDVLNLSIGSEKVFKILLLPGDGEVLDVEVASLLGVLVSDGLLELLLFSLLLGKEMSDVKLHWLAVGSHTHVLVHQFLTGFIDSFGSVHLVVGVLVADESKLTLDLIVLLSDARLDLSKRIEEVLDSCLGVAEGNVLEVKVVNHLDGGILQFSGLELGA